MAIFMFVVCFLLVSVETAFGQSPLVSGFRPPSVPLVVVDPYLSIWSNADNLYDDITKHWSGAAIALTGMIRIDGKAYRFMSKTSDLAQDVMTQVKLTVYPSQTVYVFEEIGVRLTVKFSTPAMADGDNPVTYPLTYISYKVDSIDDKTHNIQLYYDNTAEGTVSDVSEPVTWDRISVLPGQAAMRIGTAAQKYLGQGSDRINWGYWYVSVIIEGTVQTSIGYSTDVRTAFIQGDKLPPDDTNKPRPCSTNWPVLAVSWDIGMVVPNTTSAMRHLQIFYDQVYSISYFGTPMMPLWRHLYGNISGIVQKTDYETITDMCDMLDLHVVMDLYKAGGDKYATFTSLAWRQAVGGLVAVWNDVLKTTWLFMKEISSDGDVSTVDVIYPASPIFVANNPDVLKLVLIPILEYANNNTKMYGMDIPYTLPWAPHHLGHWPICDLSPNRQEQMPMEETGNMLIMIAAVVMKKNDISFLNTYWTLLKTWADNIAFSLPDPENQLCTDDFEGRSPHNVNLAAKGIVGLAAYSYLLKAKGDTEEAELYDKLNSFFVDFWMTKANDTDHYQRQFDLPNSWSLKYNLLYQKILKFDLFNQSVFDVEEAYYMMNMSTYGIPLDDRHPYTKTDWLMWIAALGNDQQFEAISNAVYKFANETTDRSPFTDWYNVKTGRRQGFTARPVIGGLYAKLLTS